MGPADALRDLIAPPLATAGLELWDVEVEPASVCVFVERTGGIDLDGLAVASATVSALVDDHPDLVPPGRYELEVSSPGIERTLRTVEHHRRYLGTPVSVKTTTAVDGARRWQGMLVDVDDDAIFIVPDEAETGVRIRLPHDLISRTRTVMVWSPTPKPGTRPAHPRTKPAPSATPAPRTTPLPEDARS